LNKLATVDVISGKITFNYNSEWIKKVFDKTGKEFGDTFGDHTGNILYTSVSNFNDSRQSSFNYNGWKLTLVKTTDRLTGEMQFTLYIKGNPSAIYFGGNNYRNIPLDAFRSILSAFCDTFCLDINSIKISAPTEISITVVDPPNMLLEEHNLRGRLLTFQGVKEFHIKPNNDGNFMGYEAKANKEAHSSFKVYLPAVKFNEPRLNFLRVERKYSKVQSFITRTGINTWADLITDQGQHECLQIVLDGWNDVMVFDPTLKASKRNLPYLNEMIKRGCDFNYWLKDFHRTASDKTRKRRIAEYNKLAFDKGEGLHTKIRNWITCEQRKSPNYYPKLIGNNSELIKDEKEDTNTELIKPTSPEVVRTCKACNKPINQQRKGSRYCSKKYVGNKAAKQCRNKVSNQKHNEKRRENRNSTSTLPLSKENIMKPTFSIKDRLQQIRNKIYKASPVPT
jgi:hypothetical protein